MNPSSSWVSIGRGTAGPLCGGPPRRRSAGRPVCGSCTCGSLEGPTCERACPNRPHPGDCGRHSTRRRWTGCRSSSRGETAPTAPAPGWPTCCPPPRGCSGTGSCVSSTPLSWWWTTWCCWRLATGCRPTCACSARRGMLTGESAAVRPGVGGSMHAGTFVVEGAGQGHVAATGGRTRLAAIAALTNATRRPPSPLALQLHRVVLVVAVIAVATGIVAFGISLALGADPTQGFLFAVGVTVALVPEGLLPTVTLSLARGAQRMAARNALVRRLESVETLGSTTFICTDKTGTLTRNQMAVVDVWTPTGTATIEGQGYEPTGDVHADAVSRPERRRFPFDPRRRRMSILLDDRLLVKGAPDAVLPRCRGIDGTTAELDALAYRG